MCAAPTALAAVPAQRHDDHHYPRLQPSQAQAPAPVRAPSVAAVRLSRVVNLTARLGSVVTLSALALLCVALAAGIVGLPPGAGPTMTVTYDAEH